MSTQSQYMAHCNDGDQKNLSKKELASKDSTRFQEGKNNSHLSNDSKDQRSIANRLESELKKKDEEDSNDPNVPSKGQNPTDLARQHGNEPSKGAKIDEQIQLEEEAEFRRAKQLKIRSGVELPWQLLPKKGPKGKRRR